MSSIDLETKIEGLKKAIAEHKDFTGTYESQLKTAEQELKDLGKISLPSVVFDDIYEAVEKAVSEYDFSDSDNYDKEFEIDYDNRIALSTLELTNTTDLTEMIVEKVSKLFTEMDCPEEDDAVEKVFTQEAGSC
jgi:hypothetical protein